MQVALDMGCAERGWGERQTGSGVAEEALPLV
jgi:hypothetical protein